MPQLHLSSTGSHLTLPVRDPLGTRLLLPRTQFRCWVRLPGMTMPRDGILDTGSPFTWIPEAIWQNFQSGIDYEELPFDPGYTAPRGQTAGWNFTFRMARMLQPIALFDTSTELERHGVIVQFANGNPPIPPGSQRPAFVVIGLWGGVLEGTALRVSTDGAVGTLEW